MPTVLESYNFCLESTTTPLPTGVLQEAGDNSLCRKQLEAAAIITLHFESFRIHVLRKQKPYTMDGYDFMLVVTPEKIGLRPCIEHLGMFTQNELTSALNFCLKMLNIHLKLAQTENINLCTQAIGINCHINPLRLDTYGRKTYAQTLKPLHIHVVSWPKGECSQTVSTDHLSKEEKDDLRDPLHQLIDNLLLDLIKNPSSQFAESYIENGSLFVPVFDVSRAAYILREFHLLFCEAYEHLFTSIVIPESRDEIGYPTIRGSINWELEKNISDKTKRHIERLKCVLTSSKKAIELRQRLFLKGPAYTVGILKKNNALELFFTPRLISTGNLLESLGIVRLIGNNPPPSSWLERQAQREKALSEILTTST